MLGLDMFSSKHSYHLVTGLVVVLAAHSASIGYADEVVTTNKASNVVPASKNQPAASQASREPAEASRSRLVSLIAGMDDSDPNEAKRAYHALFHMVQQVLSEQERQVISKKLANELSAKHSIDTRRKLCRLLSYIGNDECVDALYKMFLDADLREMVRWSLIRIPSRRATQALAAALQITEGEFRIALLNAIGEKGDKRAVPLLRSGANSPDEAIRRASVDALARMPDSVALATILHVLTLEKPGSLQSLLTSGATLADAGMLKEAHIAFQAAGDCKSLTAAECCQVMYGLGRVGEARDVTTVLTMIGDRAKWQKDWPRIRVAGLQALIKIPGKQATNTLAEKMASSSGPTKVDLLDVLRQRVSEMTEDATAKIRKALADSDEQVRRAATAAIKAIENDF